jgi:hopanoid biosynthesis associated RND transporter like protein HpnN
MTSPQVPPESPRHITTPVHKARSILTGLVGRSFTKALVHWVDLCRRRASVIVVAALALTAACGYYAATSLGVQTNSDALLSQDLPYRKIHLEFTRAFPMLSDNLVILVDAPTADQAEDAARKLAARLKAEPELFNLVFYPPSEPFFRTNGLLLLSRKDLQETADQLADAQPLLSKLAADMSLRGFFDVLGLAADEIAKGTEKPGRLARVFDATSDTTEALLQGRDDTRLSWRELMSAKPLTPDERRQIIVVQPKIDFTSLSPAEKAIDAIRQAARDLRVDGANGVSVQLTGGAALDQDEIGSVKDGVGLASFISLALVTLLAFLGFRSPRLVLAAAATLIMSLVWTAGYATLAVGHLNLISVAFAVLFIGLAVDFSIQFGLRYKEAVDARLPHAEALRAAAAGTGVAVGLAAVCAAIGFFSFVPTSYVGLRELGIISGGSMFIGVFGTMTVLPAILTLLPPRPASHPPKKTVPLGFGHVLLRHGRAICLVALAVGIFSLATLPWTRFDFDPINLKDPETESVRAYLQMTKDSGISPYSINVVESDLRAADAVASELDKLPEVDSTVTLSSFVPEEQDDKLFALDQMATFLTPVLDVPNPKPPPGPGERRRATESFLKSLEALAASPRAGPLAAPSRRLVDVLSKYVAEARDSDDQYRRLETALLGTLPARLDDLREAMKARAVTLDDLPADLKRRYVTPDGRARIEVFPSKRLTVQQNLIDFVDAVRGIAPDATDTPVELLEGGRAVTGAFKEAGVIAFVLISCVLALMLQSFIDSVLVLLPLGLAGALTVAITVLGGQPFNFANIIALPLLFSLGVGFGIYLVLRYRETSSIDALMNSSTPRAVVFSALTTMVSFATLMISSHRGTASMGELLTLCLTLALACTLIVLPALFVWRDRPES